MPLVNLPVGIPAGGGARAATYFAEFPEDIRLYGVSFNTAGPAGIAIQGEYSYRPKQPLQLSSIELLLATLGAANNITGGAAAAAAVPIGTEITGWREVKMHQAQVTPTKSFGPPLGSGQFVVVGEAGYTYLDLPSGLLFNGPAVFLPAEGSNTGTSFGSTQPGMQGSPRRAPGAIASWRASPTRTRSSGRTSRRASPSPTTCAASAPRSTTA